MHTEYITHGVGFRVGNQIFLNENLKSNPELHNAILKHERKHTGRFSRADLELDLKGKHITGLKKQYYKFIINNPKSLTQFIPILKIDGNWTLDLGILFIWLFSIFIGAMVWILI